MHGVAKAWAANHLRVSGIKISLQGIEHLLPSPSFLMGNQPEAPSILHPSGRPAVPYKWLANGSFSSFPFSDWSDEEGGPVSIDRGKPREALKAIRRGGAARSGEA